MKYRISQKVTVIIKMANRRRSSKNAPSSAFGTNEMEQEVQEFCDKRMLLQRSGERKLSSEIG